MQLYERLLKLVELFENNSQTQFAKRLCIPQPTFFGYLNSDGQEKIRKSLLDKILAIYPEVNREWLFFGEGEPLSGTKAMSGVPCREEKRRIAELEAELTEERRLNRDLTRRLLKDSVGRGAATIGDNRSKM